MSEMRTAKKSADQDIWFQGIQNQLPSGEICYFICQYLEERYPDTPGESFYTVCTKRNEIVEDHSSYCGMDCDIFGRCSTCRGFSAVRCQECFIPRE